MPNRQRRRPPGGPAIGAGIGVDAHGGPVIDPTENVLALVDAESRFRDRLRESDIKYQDDQRAAETRRIDGLASERRHFESVIEGMRNASLALLATQVKETKDDLSERITKLEVGNAQTSGRGLGINAVAGGLFAVITIGISLVAIYLRH